MITQDVIFAKYHELYDQYADRHIDDYEIFVCSRVAEFFLNNSEETVESILDSIECAFSNTDANTSFEETIEDDNDNDNDADDEIVKKSDEISAETVPSDAEGDGERKET